MVATSSERHRVDKILENSDYIGRIYLRDNCLKVIDCLITITILFFAMLFIKPVLSLIVLIAYPIYFALELGLEKIITLGKTNHETATANFKGIIDNNFNNVKSIKLLNSIEFENERFDDVANEYLKAKDENLEMVHNRFSLINIEKIQFSLVDSFKLLDIEIEEKDGVERFAIRGIVAETYDLPDNDVCTIKYKVSEDAVPGDVINVILQVPAYQLGLDESGNDVYSVNEDVVLNNITFTVE